MNLGIRPQPGEDRLARIAPRVAVSRWSRPPLCCAKEDGVTSVLTRSCALLAAGAVALLASGCSSAERPEVERVATAFEDSSGDPQERCDLLSPRTLEQLEEQLEKPCAEGIGDVPLEGGEVESVEVWGGDAQVTLSGDTVFLTHTATGWRVDAAVCTPQVEGPYDCEVES
jgi:hypothetical protein